MAIMSREEHLRSSRRRRRQLLGILICFLVFLGTLTLLGGLVRGIRHLFDDTALKEEYRGRLQCYTMLDPLAYDSIDKAETARIAEYGVWSVVNNAMASADGLSHYERDPDTDGVLLPALEVDAAVARLFGPNYTIPHDTFQSSDMTFLYLEEKQAFLIPVTGQVGLYTPTVEKIRRSHGNTIVTVGYIPTFTAAGTFHLANSTEPTKYMDYVFEKSGRSWYLIALQNSEMSPAAAETPTETPAVPTTAPQEAIQGELEANSDLANELGISDSSASSQPEPEEDEDEDEDEEPDEEEKKDS